MTLPRPPAGWKRPAMPVDIQSFKDENGEGLQPYYAAYLVLNSYSCMTEAKEKTGGNWDYMRWIQRMWRMFEKERGMVTDGSRRQTYADDFLAWLQHCVDRGYVEPSLTEWAGPLFYPPVGMIAVMKTGRRIEIWDDESDADCFTGLLLLEGRTETQRVVFDLSCQWDRTQIDHIEEPTDDDLRLGGLPREAA